MRAAGSAPGVAKKIRNTSTLMPNITNSIWPSRWTRASSIRRVPMPIFERGIERVAHAVAEDVEGEHA